MFFDGVLALLLLALWIFCLIDVIRTPSEQVRTLPKLMWLVIVFLLTTIGSIAWLLLGRPWAATAQRTSRAAGSWRGLNTPRAPLRNRPMNPDDDEEFLAKLAAQVAEQKRQSRDDGDNPTPTG